jgi:endonuclease/exonuclease/phosphatase (EEP) superfamily protein YafD
MRVSCAQIRGARHPTPVEWCPHILSCPLPVQAFHRILTALLALLCVGSVLALAAPLGWPFELFAHFRAQYAAAGVVLAALFAWRRRAAPAVLGVAMALWHSAPGIRSAVAAGEAPACDGAAFTVLTANLQYSNGDPAAFLAWLATRPADLVLLQEVTAEWAATLEARSGYAHRLLSPREDPYGIGVLGRVPLETVGLLDLANDGLPSIAGTVAMDGQRVRFLGLHTRWPVVPGLAELRDLALVRAAAIAREGADPLVLGGDLNLTPYAPAYGQLIAESGLVDVMHGRGWQPTWNAGFWPLALRIDHLLVSPGVCVEHAEVGPAIGSDHRPVIARLRLPKVPG